MKKVMCLSVLLPVFVFSCEKDYSSLDEDLNSNSNFNQSKNSKINVRFDKELLKTNLENLRMKEDIDIIDGIIYFKNQQVFDKYSNNISSLKNEIKELKSPQFEKKEKQFKEIQGALENSKSFEQIKNNIDKYSDFLVISDSTIYFKKRKSFDYLFSDYNSNYFFIGNMIHLFEDDEIFLIIDGDLEKVKKIKSKNINVENVFSFKTPKRINSKAKTNLSTIPISDFLAFRRQSNPYDSGKRGTVGILIEGPVTTPNGTNGQGIPVFRCSWNAVEQGYAERRTAGFWFTVNSNLILNSNGYFGVTSSTGNVAYGNYSNGPASGYDNELNYVTNQIYSQNSNGGVLSLTQTEINNLSYYVFNSSGYFQTGQVPNINIIW
jgi:hypothetical protein